MMRYDDPARPKHGDVSETALQVNGSPLPCITLIRPMLSEEDVTWHCVGRAECSWEENDTRSSLVPGPNCEHCTRTSREVWGWLASIHAHREGARFGYHTGFISDLSAFHRAWLEDPEAALAKWFKYYGPEAPPARVARKVIAVVEADLWGDCAEGET
jgi:hypothetical protein